VLACEQCTAPANAAISAWYWRQLTESPLVEPALPAGMAAHALRHLAVLTYCELMPAQFVMIVLQYVTQCVDDCIAHVTFTLGSFAHDVPFQASHCAVIASGVCAMSFLVWSQPNVFPSSDHTTHLLPAFLTPAENSHMFDAEEKYAGRPALVLLACSSYAPILSCWLPVPVMTMVVHTDAAAPTHSTDATSIYRASRVGRGMRVLGRVSSTSSPSPTARRAMHSNGSPPNRHQNSSVSTVDAIGLTAVAGGRGTAARFGT
jgi:hypothetical protein